jgi:type IV pilus secretin PilQ/predicted competence protein
LALRAQTSVQPAETQAGGTGVPGVDVFRVTRASQVRAFDYTAPEAQTDTQQLVTMVVKDADIGSVLQLLASQFNLNLLTTSDVKGTVSFQFTNVPLQTALDVLVKAGQANYIRAGDVFLVKPIKTDIPGDLQTRVFNLDYAEANDVKTTITKLLSSKGNADIGYRRVGNGGASMRSSMLVVTDAPENLNNIERVIRDLDQPVPQIAIEAKFVETNLDDNSLYGIDWQVQIGASGMQPLASAANSAIQLPIHLGNMLLGRLDLGNLAAVLNLLRTRGSGRLLANPRAITLDDQTATMTVSTELPIREVRIDPGTQAQTITWTREAIPTTLSVTPHVLADGTIDMDVEPSVEDIIGYSGPTTDQQPITSKREAKTQIRVRDGEVAVIGGLVREQVIKNVKKVPLLGDIPILGELFKSTNNEITKTDLLIFIIPHVLPAQ